MANRSVLGSQRFGEGNDRISLTDPVANQITYYCGPTEYTEYGGNGVLVWTRSIVYFGDSILSTTTPNGSGGESIPEYNHPDRLGSRMFSWTNGTYYVGLTEQVHLPFGNALNAESSRTNFSKRFTSYERSAATGLDYAQNRTYDSKQGRFTQVDPIGMGDASLVNPQSLNLYSYCYNDPINHTDPSGLGFFSFLKKLFKWILVAVAIVAAIALIVYGAPTLMILSGVFSAGSNLASALGHPTLAKILGYFAMAFGAAAGLQAAHNSMIYHFGTALKEAHETLPLWVKILAGISSVGATANSFEAKTSKKSSREQAKKICHWLQAELGLFSKIFSDLWAKTQQTGKEAGGYLAMGLSGEVGSGGREAYDWEPWTGGGEGDHSMPSEFTRWLRGKHRSIDPRNTADVWVHTHPHGTLMPSGSSVPQGSGLGTISGDYGVVADTGLQGAIITANKVMVFDANKPICTFSR
jgi:RHS repeat-associated protein